MWYIYVHADKSLIAKEKDMVRVLGNCNAYTATPRFFAMRKHPLLICRRKFPVSFRVTRAPVLSMATTNPSSRLQVERLQLGSLAHDGVSYKEKFKVRSYEVGMNKTATIETIAKLLQEVACNRNHSLGFSTEGFGTTLTMRKLNLIWVIARMHIEIYKYPAWNDVVEIEIRSQGEGKIRTRGDWILKDFSNGEIIGWATSKWVMMNQDTRRIEKVSGDVRDEYLVFFPETTHRLEFPEDVNNRSKMKIPKLNYPPHFSKLGLVPRRTDLDMNQHVNNVTYISWVLENMPQEVTYSHELQSITLDYRYECQHGDVVDSLANLEATEDGMSLEFDRGRDGSSGSNLCQFLHLVRLSDDGHEINRGRTVWRKK